MLEASPLAPPPLLLFCFLLHEIWPSSYAYSSCASCVQRHLLLLCRKGVRDVFLQARSIHLLVLLLPMLQRSKVTMAEEHEVEDAVLFPLSVDYCGVCSMPPEVLLLSSPLHCSIGYCFSIASILLSPASVIHG